MNQLLKNSVNYLLFTNLLTISLNQLNILNDKGCIDMIIEENEISSKNNNIKTFYSRKNMIVMNTNKNIHINSN